MDSRISIHKAQSSLTELLGQAEKAGDRFIIERNGQPLGAIVSIGDLRRIERKPRDGNPKSKAASAKTREESLVSKLGRRHTLAPVKAKRLRELITKEDEEERLTLAEKRELKQLLREHEGLMVRRAQALGEVS